jgi:hypothetical protein
MKLPLTPPKHVIEQRLVFIAVNQADRRDRFKIEAPSETAAKVVLIDKLGYVVEQDKAGTFWLVDDENKNRRVELESKTLDEAYDEVLQAARWSIMEPDELIGEDDDNE